MGLNLLDYTHILAHSFVVGLHYIMNNV